MTKPRDTRNDPLARIFPPDLHRVAPGGIEELEAEGAAAMQAGECTVIPTEGAADGDLAALGFKLGSADRQDPLFREATLPPGWKRTGTGHSMWTNIVDEHGRERISIFYKAAPYDRRASLSICTVQGYVRAVADGKGPLVIDDTWATRDAITTAIGDLRRHAVEQREFWAARDAREYIDQYQGDIDRLDALAASLTGTAP